jgi:hypothetical protein
MCSEVGKNFIFVPISAIIAEAAVTSIPGIEHNKDSAYGWLVISLDFLQNQK